VEDALKCDIVKEPLSVTLVIPLSKGTGPLFRQIYSRLREAILCGTLRRDEKLPSTRELAEQLGISRTVVLLAYDQLLAEGFAVGRGGSGTYVSNSVGETRARRSEPAARMRLSRFGTFSAEAWARVNFPAPRKRPLPYDFAYGLADVETFPFAMWRRTLLRCARRAPASEFEYGPSGGRVSLREAICAHLQRSRAVACEPSQVMVVNGSQQALDLIARVLIERGDRVVIEDPCYQGTREILQAAGAHLLPITLDRNGMDPAKIPPNVRMIFLTPSHQFPSGVLLPLARRIEFLAWARQTNSILVEDDYDGEFRYEGASLESLQGLDREGRVIYVGTFSRTIFSALRIGYLVAPKRLVPAFSAAKWLCDRHTATLEQETLAEFISSGMYERYLRSYRRRNAARRNALLEAIREHLQDRVEITGDGAGAHIVLWPRRGIAEQEVIAAAASRGVGVYGISPYHLKRPGRAGIMLGYSRLRENEIREGIRRLGEVL
jgi:GntR family transcriptional regulator / MocR family aminotransferase